jgi:hypothetical protein
LNWSDPVVLKTDLRPPFFNDKETVTADPTRPGYAYVVWDRVELAPPPSTNFFQVAWFTRTTNGGATWEPSRAIYDPGLNNGTLGHQIVVLPNGTLLNFFNLSFDDFASGNVAVMRSTDQGETWSEPLIISPMNTDGFPPDPDSSTRIRASFWPNPAVDPRNGNIYVVWPDRRFGGGVFEQVAFSQSTDGGFTWSTPVKINKTPPRPRHSLRPSRSRRTERWESPITTRAAIRRIPPHCRRNSSSSHVGATAPTPQTGEKHPWKRRLTPTSRPWQGRVPCWVTTTDWPALTACSFPCTSGETPGTPAIARTSVRPSSFRKLEASWTVVRLRPRHRHFGLRLHAPMERSCRSSRTPTLKTSCDEQRVAQADIAARLLLL